MLVGISRSLASSLSCLLQEGILQFLQACEERDVSACQTTGTEEKRSRQLLGPEYIVPVSLVSLCMFSTAHPHRHLGFIVGHWHCFSSCYHHGCTIWAPGLLVFSWEVAKNHLCRVLTSATTYATEIFETKYVGIWYFIAHNGLFVNCFFSLCCYISSVCHQII